MGGTSYQNVLVVGAGAMAVEHHLPRLLSILGASRVDLLDLDSERRRYLKQRFRKNARIGVLERLDASRRYDLAVIATSPRSHPEVYGLVEEQAGAILIEKPLAIGTREGEWIEERATRSRKPVFVNLFRRALWNFSWIRSLYRTGVFGTLRAVTVAEGSVFSWRAASMAPFSRELSGGGVLIDTGPHTVDLLFQVFDRVELVSARMDAEPGGVEANCTLDLLADVGVPVSLALSRNRHLSNRAVFEFERATLSAAVVDDSVTLALPGVEPGTVVPAGRPSARRTFAELNDAYYRNFLANGDSSRVGPLESLKGLRVIERAYEIAQPYRDGF